MSGQPAHDNPTDILFAAVGGKSPDTRAHYDWLRSHAPVFFCPTLNAYVVSRYADCRLVLQSPQFRSPESGELRRRMPEVYRHASLAFLMESIINTTGDKHARLRDAIAPAFSFKQAQKLKPAIQKAADAIVERAARDIGPREPRDFRSLISIPLPLNVIGDLLGVSQQDRGDMFNLVTRMVDITDPSLSQDRLRDADAAFHELGRWCDRLADERRIAPGDDLISDLVRAETEGKLSREERQIMNYTMWFAGFETTVAVIDNCVLALIEHPELRAELESEEKTLRLIDEIMRWSGVAQTTNGVRFAVNDIELSGVRIPRDGRVILLLAAAHGDPDAYGAPAAIDVSRKGPAGLSFGSGAHYCVGTLLARLEAAALLRTLFQRIPTLRLAGPPVPHGTFSLKNYRTIPVTAGA